MVVIDTPSHAAQPGIHTESARVLLGALIELPGVSGEFEILLMKRSL